MDYKKENTIIQFIKFNIIGIINTILTYLIFSVLIYYGINYNIALIIDYSFGVTFSYFFNRSITFKFKESQHIRTFSKMLIAYLITFLINWSLLLIFIEKLNLNKYLAQFFALGIAVSVSFLMQKYFVFFKKKENIKDE